jgi:hypothetical protein
MNVIDVVGWIGRTPLLLLILRRAGLRNRRTSPMRRTIPGLRKNRSCDHSHKRHSREQFLHGIVSWVDLGLPPIRRTKLVEQLCNARIFDQVVFVYAIFTL